MDKYTETAEWLKEKIMAAGKALPETAVVLGSGLGKLADSIEEPLVIPYSEIPGFKVSTAVGHKSNLIVGTLGGKPILAMQGRFHYYEGYTMEEVTYPMRVFAKMGVKRVLVSNAAGTMNPDFRVGDLMIITDHINLMPNPLIGPNKDEFGPRFPDMSEPYSRRLRSIALETAKNLGMEIREGVYVGVTGPTYETLAEYRAYRIMGGDAVGMSTVPEVIVARHSGMEVFALSVITDQANDLGNGTVNDENDVVLQADKAAERMTRLFMGIIKEL
jgi:purine-nucleoside phosphorylase